MKRKLKGLGRPVAPAVGCLAILIQPPQGAPMVVATVHQNPPADMALGIMDAVRQHLAAGYTVACYELERCEHCALGPRDITMRPVDFAPAREGN